MDDGFEEIDDGETLWRFDREFLQSNWTCIWGNGCLGILAEPAAELNQGCCSIGAEIDGGDESRRVAGLAATLEPASFQFHAEAGAPEGALYVNGQLVGHLTGVTRL